MGCSGVVGWQALLIAGESEWQHLEAALLREGSVRAEGTDRVWENNELIKGGGSRRPMLNCGELEIYDLWLRDKKSNAVMIRDIIVHIKNLELLVLKGVTINTSNSSLHPTYMHLV